jgi:hypothetical protein
VLAVVVGRRRAAWRGTAGMLERRRGRTAAPAFSELLSCLPAAAAGAEAGCATPRLLGSSRAPRRRVPTLALPPPLPPPRRGWRGGLAATEVGVSTIFPPPPLSVLSREAICSISGSNISVMAALDRRRHSSSEGEHARGARGSGSCGCSDWLSPVASAAAGATPVPPLLGSGDSSWFSRSRMLSCRAARRLRSSLAAARRCSRSSSAVREWEAIIYFKPLFRSSDPADTPLGWAGAGTPGHLRQYTQCSPTNAMPTSWCGAQHPAGSPGAHRWVTITAPAAPSGSATIK